MIASAPPKMPQSQSDWSDVHELQKKLMDHSDALSAMASDTGKAKHCLEFSSDMRKRALARAMQAALAGGDSVSKAEAEGRASPGYSQELAVLARQHEAAEIAIAEYDTRKIAWETARSLLAALREAIQRI